MPPTRKKSGKPSGSKRGSDARGRRDRVRGPRVKWEDAEPRTDHRGKPYKRFYKFETLANAIAKHLGEGQPFLSGTIQNAMGGSRLTTLGLNLVDENTYRLEFRLTAVNERRKRATYYLVVAKNAIEHTNTLKKEYANLRMLHARAPEMVIDAAAEGLFFLPDRYRREKQGREVHAYLASWPVGYQGSGLDSRGQFVTTQTKRASLTRRDTEHLKVELVNLFACCYDPAQRKGIRLPLDIEQDLWLRKTDKAPPKLLLKGCRELSQRMKITSFIDSLIRGKLKGDGHVAPLIPEDPADFLDAVKGAWGAKEAHARFKGYRHALENGQMRERYYLSRDVLDELLIEGEKD